MDWERLIDEHGAALVLYARQWSNSHADAEDNVHDAIVRLARKHRTFSTGEVFTAVKRTALDRLRSEKRRRKREDLASRRDATDPVFQPGAMGGELAEDLTRALEALPEEQREVLIMKIWGELSLKEIAAQLGVPLNTAGSRYRYALEKMRRHFD